MFSTKDTPALQSTIKPAKLTSFRLRPPVHLEYQMMQFVGRLGRFLIRLEESGEPATRDLDQRLAEFAAIAKSRTDENDNGARLLHEIIVQAWEIGKTIELPNVFYGPSHFGDDKEFASETYPYYFFLSGLIRSQNCRAVFEIGTHFGGSCLAMLRGAVDTASFNLVTVDVTDLNPQLHKTTGISKLVGDANSNPVIKESVLRFYGKPIDLLYVDARHTFSSTITNIGLYSLLLRPRFLVIDDIMLNDEMRSLWNVIVSIFGNNAVNCVDLIPEIRSPRVGFGLARLR